MQTDSINKHRQTALMQHSYSYCCQGSALSLSHSSLSLSTEQNMSADKEEKECQGSTSATHNYKYTHTHPEKQAPTHAVHTTERMRTLMEVESGIIEPKPSSISLLLISADCTMSSRRLLLTVVLVINPKFLLMAGQYYIGFRSWNSKYKVLDHINARAQIGKVCFQ